MRSQLVAMMSLGLVACGPQPTTSYVRDIQPLVERSCQTCHVTGGIAPFALETPEQAKAMGPTMLADVQAGKMPPFLASTACNSYRHDTRFSADEIALLATWVDEGMPIGDVATSKHAVIDAIPTVRHDLSLSTGAPYDVRTMTGLTDNYHCFVMDPEQVNDVMVAGYEVTPGNIALVHHLLAYVIPPAKIAELTALDDAEEGPGYTCQSGSVGISGAIQNQIAGWVPGGTATRLPDGTALTLKGGSRIVVQIHYNLAALSAGASPTDQTSLALELTPVGSKTEAKILPMLDPALDIKANDPKSVQQLAAGSALFAGATVYSLMGHMHLLGKEVKLEVVPASGAPVCLLDIPSWDFNWQRNYELTTPYVLKSGDKLRITCTYDNSQANQAYLNGAQRMSQDVQWGESSFDEMCMTYMTFTK